MKKKLLILTIGLTALAFAGCESTTPNSNTAANRPNSNQAVVVNSNQNVATKTNANRWTNTNVNRADYDKDRAEYEKDKGNSKIGTGVNDSWLWFKTRAALLAVDDLRDSTINVDVDNEVITLHGTVANPAQKKKAFDTANSIEGKKSVKDELKVAPNDSITNTGGSNTNSKPATNANAKK